MGAPVSVGIADHTLPEWWNDVLEAKAAGKKIVAVSSSSVVFDTSALIKPALEAFGGRDDVFVIATLVTSDVETLDFEIPENARVAKFIPLDLALPYVCIPVAKVGLAFIVANIKQGNCASYEWRIRHCSTITPCWCAYDYLWNWTGQIAYRSSH